MTFQPRLLIFMLVFGVGSVVMAQNEPPATTPAAAPADNTPAPQASPPAAEPTTEKAEKTLDKVTKQTEDELKKITKQVDQNPQAQQAAAGILQPIYIVAEALAFPAFHWLAFALMSAGVFSFALQLVLGKLVVLLRRGFSVKEIASDAAGLAISIVGLVLTTQAAAENSTFTQSPAAVISATVAGAVLGIVLYLWGQAQELDAVAGRTRAAAKR